MKNEKIKFNKTKIVARVMLVVLLLSSAINLSGCGQEYKYMYIAHHRGSTNVIQSIVYSSDAEFDIDNVNINGSYGVHKLNIFGEVKPNPKDQVASGTYKNYNFSLSAYICNCVEYHEENSTENTSCILFNYITDEELFSKEFGYIHTPSFINNGVVYNHTDNVVIPEYMFDKDWGIVYIRLQLYVYLDDIDVNCLLSEDFINLEYIKTGDKIEFYNYWL